MAGRPLLLCAVFLAVLGGVHSARRRYGSPPRAAAQRRFGTPFSGDIHQQSFEDYLAKNGVSFDSLFEEPSDLRSERPAPAGRRASPSSQRAPAAPYEDSFPPVRPAYRDPAPLPPPADYRRQQRPQTFLYGDDAPSYAAEPLSYGDLTERRRPYDGPVAGRDELRPGFGDLGSPFGDLGSAGRPQEPEPAVRRRVVVQRPERARRPVVELLPAPSPAVPRSRSTPEPNDYVAPFPEQERRDLLPALDFDQPQAAATPRQDGYSLNIPKKKEKQRLEFQVHGQEGPHSYRFGYDTGTGYNRQFRFEERDGYGNTKGRYGFYDKSGKLQVVNYSASPKGGFHAEGDFGKYPNAGH